LRGDLRRDTTMQFVLSLSVQVMMKLARRSLKTRRMMLERMMAMMVKLQPCMYPLLPLRRLRCRMVHPLHRLRFSKIKWKQLLRGRLSLGERHRGAYKLIIHPQESSATSMSVRHSRGLEMLLTLLIKLLWPPLSRKTLDMLCLILIG
jgi:hypothetical protein